MAELMEPVTIRVEQPSDAVAVRAINQQAFGSPLEGRIVERLRDASGTLSLVATSQGELIGHILFSPVTIEPACELRVAGLGPMSVRPDRQRVGVGSRLVRAGLDACRDRGYSAVVVVGHPTYYPRFGFEPADAWGLTLCDFDVPREAFMVVAVEPAAQRRVSGAVRYRREFAEAEEL
jgi:putative acetyltransferase